MTDFRAVNSKRLVLWYFWGLNFDITEGNERAGVDNLIP